MRRDPWHEFLPSLLLALGIIVAQAAQGASSDLVATLILVFALLCADALASRKRGLALRPSPAAWVLGGAFALMGAIAMAREPGHDRSLIPLLGLGAWVALFMRDGNHRVDRCRRRDPGERT